MEVFNDDLDNIKLFFFFYHTDEFLLLVKTTARTTMPAAVAVTQPNMSSWVYGR